MNTCHYRISEAYQNRLAIDYGPRIARTIACQWELAELPHEAQGISYVRLQGETELVSPKPVLFVYGYTGGIVANAPFGAAMAKRGFDIIIPDQNRRGFTRNELGARDATHLQARNLASIIEKTNLTKTPIDLVSHSFGSLIAERLVQYGAQRGWQCFDGSKVVMLAPAGIKEDEQPLDFLRRYKALLSAGKTIEKFPDSYWEFEKEMFAAGTQFVKQNIPRALLEGWEIMRRTVSLKLMLAHGVDKIALVPFAEDRLYSEATLERSLGKLVSDRVTAFSPYSALEHGTGLRGGRGADHSDQQFNPERVADSTAQFLRSQPFELHPR